MCRAQMLTWRASSAARIRPIARTKATQLISVCVWASAYPRMRYGLMRSRFLRWRRSPGGWRSIGIASTRLKSRDRYDAVAPGCAYHWRRGDRWYGLRLPLSLRSCRKPPGASEYRGAARLVAHEVGRLWLWQDPPQLGNRRV